MLCVYHAHFPHCCLRRRESFKWSHNFTCIIMIKVWVTFGQIIIAIGSLYYDNSRYIFADQRTYRAFNFHGNKNASLFWSVRSSQNCGRLQLADYNLCYASKLHDYISRSKNRMPLRVRIEQWPVVNARKSVQCDWAMICFGQSNYLVYTIRTNECRFIF